MSDKQSEDMMQPNRASPNYQAYLLRLWRDGEQGAWRASLQAPGTTEAQGFADLETLFAFLWAAANPADPPAPLTQHGQQASDQAT